MNGIGQYRSGIKKAIKEFLRKAIRRIAHLIPSHILRKNAFRLASIVPQDSKIIYEISRSYVNQFRGENNVDFYSNGEYRFMKDNIERFQVVFDVGANVGDWSRMVLSLKHDVELHCFEPASGTFAKLARRSFPKNVILNNFGLGSRAQSSQLYIFEDCEKNSLYPRRGFEYDEVKIVPTRTEMVDIQTFVAYCRSRKIDMVDFVKIDVEGNEFEVLRGMREMLIDEKVGVIQFEYGGTYIDTHVLLKDIFEFFGDLNYDLYKIFPNKIRLYREYSQEVENLQYQNWLAIRRDLASSIK